MNASIASLFSNKTEKAEKDKNKKPFQQLQEIVDTEDKEKLREFVQSYDDERFRFSIMNPVDVCDEIAEIIGGVATRVNPNNENSAPIVVKEVAGIKLSIVYYRSTKTMTVYKFSNYGKGKSKIILTRNTTLGIIKALENIEQGKIKIY